jgi:hypothetical protein
VPVGSIAIPCAFAPTVYGEPVVALPIVPSLLRAKAYRFSVVLTLSVTYRYLPEGSIVMHSRVAEPAIVVVAVSVKAPLAMVNTEIELVFAVYKCVLVGSSAP